MKQRPSSRADVRSLDQEFPFGLQSTKFNYRFFFFNVLLTVHLSIILVINQLNAQILVL